MSLGGCGPLVSLCGDCRGTEDEHGRDVIDQDWPVLTPNNAPVAFSELSRFAHEVAEWIDDRHPAGDFNLALAVDDPRDGIVLATGEDGRAPASVARFDQLLAADRRMAATVGLTGWSPRPEVPTTRALVIVAAGLGGCPATVLVRRTVEDDRWHTLDIRTAPWFALSTASSLRAALESGRPLRVRLAEHPDLFRRPDEAPSPPVDDSGML